MPRGRKKTEPASEIITAETAEAVKTEEPAAESIKEDTAKKRGRKPSAKKAAADGTAAAAEKTVSEDAPKKRGRKSKEDADAPAAAQKPAAARGRKSSKPAPDVTETLSYDKIVESVRTKAASAGYKMDFAAQITLYGDFEGANPKGGKELYIKCSDGNIDVQPYDYATADIKGSVEADALVKMLSGKLSLSDAVEQGKAEMNKLTTVTIALRDIIS